MPFSPTTRVADFRAKVPLALPTAMWRTLNETSE